MITPEWATTAKTCLKVASPPSAALKTAKAMPGDDQRHQRQRDDLAARGEVRRVPGHLLHPLVLRVAHRPPERLHLPDLHVQPACLPTSVDMKV